MQSVLVTGKQRVSPVLNNNNYPYLQGINNKCAKRQTSSRAHIQTWKLLEDHAMSCWNFSKREIRACTTIRSQANHCRNTSESNLEALYGTNYHHENFGPTKVHITVLMCISIILLSCACNKWGIDTWNTSSVTLTACSGMSSSALRILLMQCRINQWGLLCK